MEEQSLTSVVDSVSPSKNRYWDLLILVLSLYVMIELSIEIIYPFSDTTIRLINQIDFLICLVFLGDFFYFLFKSDDKKAYFKKYWIDLIASIPFITIFRAFRLVRVIRLIRLFRGMKGMITLLRMIGTNRLQNIMISYVLILLLVLTYCSLAFYSFEKGVNQGVETFFDAFWWGFITITSVGYGDVYPTTNAGRIIGMVLTVMGMGLFSLITAQLATVMLRITRSEEQKKEDRVGK